MDERILQFDYECEQMNFARARDIARMFVYDHESELAPLLERYTRDDLVRMVELYRDTGRNTDRLIADMWLMAKYDPQHVWGTMNVGGTTVVEAVELALNLKRD